MKTRKIGYRAERDFGWIVGGISLVMSVWWLYRGRFGRTPVALLLLGLLFVLSATIYPRLLRLPNRCWMRLAEILAVISTAVILSIVFFLIVTPIGVIKRMSGWDPLRLRISAQGSYWRPYSARQQDVKHYEKMF